MTDFDKLASAFSLTTGELNLGTWIMSKCNCCDKINFFEGIEGNEPIEAIYIITTEKDLKGEDKFTLFEIDQEGEEEDLELFDDKELGDCVNFLVRHMAGFKFYCTLQDIKEQPDYSNN